MGQKGLLFAASEPAEEAVVEKEAKENIYFETGADYTVLCKDV